MNVTTSEGKELTLMQPHEREAEYRAWLRRDLMALGLNMDNPKACQAAFQQLDEIVEDKKNRKNSIRHYVVGAIIGGLVSLLTLGWQAWSKHPAP